MEKVVELQNGQLAINGGRGIQIFVKDKEKGNYIEEGKNIMITTIEDYIQINENELAIYFRTRIGNYFLGFNN